MDCSYGNIKAKTLVLSCDFYQKRLHHINMNAWGALSSVIVKSNNTAATVIAISSAKPVGVTVQAGLHQT